MGFLDGLNPISAITEGIKAIGGIFDSISTTDEERLTLNNKLKVIENDLTSKILSYQAEITKYKSEVIIAEAKSGSKLTAMWRPLIMLLFGVIILNNYILNPYLGAIFSIDIMMEIPTDMWDLLKLGIGGYIGGRSIERGIELWKGKKS